MCFVENSLQTLLNMKKMSLLTNNNRGQIDVRKTTSIVPMVPPSPPPSDENAISSSDEVQTISNFRKSGEKYHLHHFEDNGAEIYRNEFSSKKDIKPGNFKNIFPNLFRNSIINSESLTDVSKLSNIYIDEKCFCNVCKKHVVKEKLTSHLFFGTLSCSNCTALILTCSSFALVNGKRKKSKLCKHNNFHWIEDPISQLEWLKEGREMPNKLFKLRIISYLSKIKDLQDEYPWRECFTKCFNYAYTTVDKIPQHKNYLPSKPEKRKKQDYADIKTPEDGNYLIMRKPVEECPLCYDKIKHERLVFDLANEMITVDCLQCKYTIYFILNPPDGTKPKVRIYEEE